MRLQSTDRNDEFGNFSCYTEDGKYYLADEQNVAETTVLYDAMNIIYDENVGYLDWHNGQPVQWK